MHNRQRRVFCARQVWCLTTRQRRCAWTRRSAPVQLRLTLQLEQLDDPRDGRTMPGGSQQADSGLPRAQKEGRQVRTNIQELASRANLKFPSVHAVAPARMRKVAPPQLDSVRDLLKQVSASSHAELYSVLRGHVYVGAVDNSRHLLQHQTQLYMVDTVAVWYVAIPHRRVAKDLSKIFAH
jgi:hypothetical protein